MAPTPDAGSEGRRHAILLLPQQNPTDSQSTEPNEATDWVWVAGVAALLAVLVGGTIALVRRRNRSGRALKVWREHGNDAMTHATTAATLLAGASSADASERTRIAEEVEQAAVALDRLVEAAPSGEAREAAHAVATRLRSGMFDAEAAGLLSGGVTAVAPSSNPELIEALSRLRVQVERILPAVA